VKCKEFFKILNNYALGKIIRWMNNINQKVALIVVTPAEKNKDSEKKEIATAYNPKEVKPEVFNNINPFFL
jgi:hypothetical protein